MNNAKDFIDEIFARAEQTEEVLIAFLITKIKELSYEYGKLSEINIFELSDEQYERGKFINDFIFHASIRVRKFRYKQAMKKKSPPTFKIIKNSLLINQIIWN